jgi:hypothetical protein
VSARPSQSTNSSRRLEWEIIAQVTWKASLLVLHVSGACRPQNGLSFQRSAILQCSSLCRAQLQELNCHLQDELGKRQQAHEDLRAQLDATIAERDQLQESFHTQASQPWHIRVRMRMDVKWWFMQMACQL